MTDSLSLNHFSMLDVDQAPESPGLYAWYVGFRAGPHDWRIKPSADGDEAIEGFLNLLRKYASYYEPLPIGLSGRGSYGAKWEGSLELDFPLREPAQSRQTSDDDDDAFQRLGTLMGSLGTEERRRVMATILHKTSPVFSAPLYIGVATNLRERLQKHRFDYTQAHDWLRDHPEDTDTIRARGKSFGQRAAARGIAMEHLEAWIIDLIDEEDDEVIKKHLRNTAESAEWLLHRLYSPILGRQ